MSFPRYEKYKDSGVEWLGEVPENWRVVRLKFICDVTTGSKDTIHKEADGEFPFFVRSESVERIGTYAFDGEAVLTAGDGAIGKIFHHYQGKLDFHQRVYMFYAFKQVLGRFFYYYISSNLANEVVKLSAKTTVDSLRLPMLQNYTFAFPDLLSQRKISGFLDHETGKIDALVAEQEKLIGLLKEKRQAVISHAVTKGLDPNARMKDSGVEWLGEVPEGWEVERGRFLYKQLDILPDEDDGVVTAFRDGQVTLRENRRTDGFTMAILEVGYQKVREGDLVIHGMDAFAGAIGVSESTGKCTPEYSVLTPLNDETENGYFAHALRIMANRNFIFVICPSVRERAPRFRFSSFKDVELPVPPALEQKNIIFHINKEISKIDTLIEEAKKAIELMKERRTALISAAVTGKIDVRGWSDGQ